MSGTRFFVSGRVQGVYFRASARKQAMELGLTGHAANLADGRVEVLAFGSPEALAQLETWLWQGPPAARVSAVEATPLAPGATPPAGFTTG